VSAAPCGEPLRIARHLRHDGWRACGGGIAIVARGLGDAVVAIAPP